MTAPRVVLGVAGASGAVLSLSIARQLKSLGAETDLVTSVAAERTLAEECGSGALSILRTLATRCHPFYDIGASIASGSVAVSGMIVAPCSMRSLAAIAHGLDDNLLTRSASVQLKERRRLVLLTREAPLTLAHLRNMTAATELGAIILPPVPAFYLKPDSVSDIVDQIAARAIDLLGVSSPVARQWAGVNEQTRRAESRDERP
ncbi:4-hydroxy-3-polyprenylbenzoate decarboxylase [Aliiroseovarius halocynthiae]|uniref:Flavin prenyltransferase UbiX n=1 Tax=Aliiroseovarius halocynthiae TaxID=985055 RepID=A0A545SKY0_9RHOB|nr:UbiX family flavin prenyltransferase [Aliiroseovarius halocynthiae]TQV65644.1 UbiX family flavin prenyltransferase [Aliiroseovarius halocynthiae]SMR84123.1 4-hydroxy-3-polyprenylbenzoate decarboxylase [Aliiroseovarius halocynthiae]